MTDFLRSGLIQEGFMLIAGCVTAGVALSSVATALSWCISNVLKLMHKLF